MSRNKGKKSTAQSRIVARLIGMLLMAGILVIFGFIGLKFLDGMNQGKKQPVAQHPKAPDKAREVTEQEPQKRARYDFYEQLSGRHREVDAEIKEKTSTTARVPEVQGSNYRIQVGAFREQEQANRMRARMILRDYPVTIIRSGKFYLVQIGPYKEKATAESIENKLRREGVDTLLKAYVND